MEILSERDAQSFLLECWRDPKYGNDVPLTFKSCPLQIRLDPGDGRGDWKAVRAINLLQQHLNLTYLLAKRGTVSGRLSEYEREMLGITFAVEAGSTKYIIENAKALYEIYKALPAHWSLRTRNIVAAAALVGIVGNPFVHEYAAYRTEVDKAQITGAVAIQVASMANQTSIEVAKIQTTAQIELAAATNRQSTLPEQKVSTSIEPAMPIVLASLVRDDASNVVAFAVSDYVPWRPALMALAPFAGTVQWNESRQVPAKEAKAIAKIVRAAATKQRRIAKEMGRPGLIATPWVTEVLRTHKAPGAMRLGISDA